MGGGGGGGGGGVRKPGNKAKKLGSLGVRLSSLLVRGIQLDPSYMYTTSLQVGQYMDIHAAQNLLPW